jgi:uncharacterized sulfatase
MMRSSPATCVLLALLLARPILADTTDGADGPKATASTPNVVLIVSDDQHWGDFGFMGHPEIRTPHLDRLAAEGAVFANGYVPSSLCRASLATIITGLYGHQHRICCNDPPEGVDRSAMLPFMGAAPALPRVLGERLEYRSLQTGKWWEGHFSNGGFTDGMTLNRAGGRHGDAGLLIGRQTMRPVLDFIDECQQKDERFLVWYAPMMPHEPHDPPERLLAKYRAPGRDERLAKYWAMCEWFDETCGQLLDHLDERKLADDTLVVFVIDNGWIQETGPARRTAGNFAPKSKRSPYDGGLRTPVIVRWPGGGVTPGRRHDDLVSTIDVAPTVLAACGLEAAGGMEGLSLLPVATGREPRLSRDAVFGEIFEHTAADVGEPALSLTHRWVRAGDWKLIVPERGGPELYDVKNDPAEERDRAAERPDDVARLRRQLDAWWRGRDANSKAP